MRTGDVAFSQLGPYLQEGVRFVGPSFARDTSVGWADVCKFGSIGGEDAAAPAGTATQ